MKHNANFIKIFLEDIIDKIIALEIIDEIRTIEDGDKMKKAIYYTHACVGILSCFGEMELSSRASKLETFLRNNKLDEYFNDLGNWLVDVRILMKNMQDHIDSEAAVSFDFEYLKTKSIALKNACKEQDFEKAHEIAGDLNKKDWPDDIKAVLLKAYTHLLRGDIDKVVNDLESLPNFI